MPASIYLQFSGAVEGRVTIHLNDKICPNAVSNLLYLTCAHEVPDDVLRAREQSLCAPLPPPLRGTRIIRVDGGRQIDIGVSASSSVFGGCYDDECLGGMPPLAGGGAFAGQNQLQELRHPRAAQIRRVVAQHAMGTLSVANCGPDSNGSRYFFSLCARPELDTLHQIVGVATPESIPVLEAIGRARVNARRANAPEPAITIADCNIIRASQVWKKVALGFSEAKQNEDENGNDQQNAANDDPSRLRQRGEMRGKRTRDEAQLGAEAARQEDVSIAAAMAAAEQGNLMRRQAKRRRLEATASGDGAWAEPQDVARSNYVTSVDEPNAGGSGGNSFGNNNNNNNNNGKKLTSLEKFQQERFQQWTRNSSGGGFNINNNNNNNNFSDDNNEIEFGQMRHAHSRRQQQQRGPLTDRNIFAAAARASQFEQDLSLVSAQQSVKRAKREKKFGGYK